MSKETAIIFCLWMVFILAGSIAFMILLAQFIRIMGVY